MISAKPWSELLAEMERLENIIEGQEDNMSMKQPTPVNRDLIKPDPPPAPPTYGKSPLQTAMDLGITQYEKRITMLEAEKDELLKLCKEAVTFPEEYRKHRIALEEIYEDSRILFGTGKPDNLGVIHIQEQEDSMIKLGQRVRDKVTGFEGIATARCEYLNGCIQYCIKPTELRKGEMIEGQYIDSQQIEIVKEEEHQELPAEGSGGPMQDTPSTVSN